MLSHYLDFSRHLLKTPSTLTMAHMKKIMIERPSFNSSLIMRKITKALNQKLMSAPLKNQYMTSMKQPVLYSDTLKCTMQSEAALHTVTKSVCSIFIRGCLDYRCSEVR